MFTRVVVESTSRQMTLAKQIAEEVRDLPDNLAREVLDFILFIEKRHAAGGVSGVRTEPDWNVIHIDTRGWHFDREEANAR